MDATSEVAAAEARQFVTFQVEAELFGVPLAEVQEIIRMLELVKVPLGPASLEGIANLRGTVLPVTSLRRIFGVDDAEHDDATRVVVVRLAGRPAGFVVDRMARVVTAEPAEIDDAAAIGATIRGDMLRGVVKRADGMVQLLAPERLLATAGGDAGARATVAGRGAGEQPPAAEAPQDDVQLVSFEAAGQECAFPIGEVQEIVQLPPSVTRLPQAQPHVLGVVTLRERLLPLVSLRGLFGLPEGALSDASRIVVVAAPGIGSGFVGLVVDRVREVLRVPRALTDPVPPMLSDGGQGRLEAICRLAGGQRLVSILSASRMFQDIALPGSLAAQGDGASAADSEGSIEEDAVPDTTISRGEEEEQVVVFRLAGEEYGVPIEAVQEIVRVPEELTHIPRTAGFIEGVVNLRGAILPVIDQRRRFALPEEPRSDRQRIMVLSIAGKRTGFIVDQVTEVLRIARGAVQPAPHLSAEQARLIRRVANLEAQRRMVLLLDPADLLDAREIEALEAA